MLPVISTKLHLPRLQQNNVARPQLIEKLNDGLWQTPGLAFSRQLTLISAPAGYGKTTLLSEWVDQLDISVAWISLEEADNEPGRFLQYLIASLRTIQPGFGDAALTLLLSSNAVDLHALVSNTMTILVNEISTFQKPFLLILDDYHTIGSPLIHQSVRFLLDHQPPTLSMVIATRSDPPLPVSRLRARRELVVVGMDNLLFSYEEAEAFLRKIMHLEIKDGEIRTLLERTEGWIAGLQMAALALKEQGDAAVFINSFSGRERFVVDYLFDEVVGCQSEDVQAFLIQTSILERMTGPLCDAVLGRAEAAPSSQQTLEYLEHGNLFLVPQDNERCYYRYHHLFKDLLRHRLNRSLPNQIENLHIRAAEWFEKQGEVSDALDHYIAAGDFNQASRLVEAFGFAYFVQWKKQQLLQWLQKIPTQVIHSRPWLCILYAWALVFSGKLSEGESYISVAESLLSAAIDTDNPETRRQFGHIAAIHQGVSAFKIDLPGITRYGTTALAYLPADDLLMRSYVEYSLSSARVLTSEFDQAEEGLTNAIHLGEAANNNMLVVNISCFLASLWFWRGRLRQAYHLLEKVAGLVHDEQGQPFPFLPPVYTWRARVHIEWNDIKAAEADLLAALEISKLYADPEATIMSLGHLSLIRISQGYLDSAEQLFQEIGQIDIQAGAGLVDFLQEYQMRIFLAKGELEKASSLAESWECRPEDEPIYTSFPIKIACAKWLMAQRKYSQAYLLLDGLFEKLQACELWTPAIHTLILQAILLDTQNEHSSAQMKMERALALAEPEGFIRAFVDEGEPARRIIACCRLHFSQKAGRENGLSSRLLDYIDTLLGAFPVLPQKVGNEALAASASSLQLYETLTDREMEVLQFIASGFTNKEIAEKLVISEATVKTHLSRIYRKLDVTGRTRALVKAREFHLI